MRGRTVARRASSDATRSKERLQSSPQYPSSQWQNPYEHERPCDVHAFGQAATAFEDASPAERRQTSGPSTLATSWMPKPPLPCRRRLSPSVLPKKEHERPTARAVFRPPRTRGSKSNAFPLLPSLPNKEAQRQRGVVSGTDESREPSHQPNPLQPPHRALGRSTGGLAAPNMAPSQGSISRQLIRTGASASEDPLRVGTRGEWPAPSTAPSELRLRSIE